MARAAIFIGFWLLPTYMSKLQITIAILSISALLAARSVLNELNGNILTDKAQVAFTFEASNVDGTFTGLTGNIVFNPNDLANASISGSVPVESITTGIGFRNWHLKREKHFDAEQFPLISYQSTSIKPKDKAYLMDGNMTMKGITKPVSFEFTYDNKAFEGTATLYASDFDISVKNQREDNKVSIRVYVPIK